jgi:uncharacterized protein with FMN-binding domain
MKKLSASILIIAFIFTLIGCSSKNKTQQNAQNNTSNNTTNNNTNKTPQSNTGKKVTYRDGVYDVVHKSTKPGYEEAVVTIKDGKIQNIVLRRLDQSKKEINYNVWDGKHDYPNLKQYRLDLAKAMVDKQSTDVNVITGATQSSNGWKAAVASALSKAQ